jgi:hypothetical protein
VADVDPQNSKTTKVRGPLASVSQQNQTYQVALRPAHLTSGDFGSVTVHTDATTSFEIDEVSSQGTAGLTALSAKPAGTATVAVGEWDAGNKQFNASQVLAGSSVPGGTRDVVVGEVIARSGDALTVRGASLIRNDGTFTFRDTLTVNLGANTKVTQQALMTTGLTKEDISVGQRVAAFGTLDGSSSALDATAGLVRLIVTAVTGTVNSTGTGSLEMTVQRISGRKITLFNFAGTGTSTATDADPAHYEVNTGSLSLTGLTAGTPVRVLGVATPFKKAAPDFNAQTLVNLNDRPATLLVNWNPSTAAPFSSHTDAGFVLDLTSVGTTHHVLRGPVSIDLSTLGTAPTIAPENPDRGLYALGSGGKVEIFTQFSKYRTTLEERLTQGKLASGVGAHGIFDDASATITADQIFTALQ